MEHKSLISAAISISLALAVSPFAGGQTLATPQAGTGEPNQEQSRINLEMMSHQRAMDIVLNRLKEDFQAVAESKDGIGTVRDKAALKTYRGDLKALGVIVTQHRQLAADYERWCGQAFTTDYAHWCGPDVKENEMAEHQQRMKATLFELSNTFETYVQADDSSIEGSPNKIEDALAAHRDAINEFAEAIKDHDHAVAQLMTEGGGSGNLPAGPLSQ